MAEGGWLAPEIKEEAAADDWGAIFEEGAEAARWEKARVGGG